jgi:hypothetical protein
LPAKNSTLQAANKLHSYRSSSPSSAQTCIIQAAISNISSKRRLTFFDSEVTKPQDRKLDWKRTHRVNVRLFKSRQGLYPDRVIVADRDQDIKERVRLHHLDILCVTLQHQDTLVLIPRLHLPYPHHLVSTAGSKELLRGAPRHSSPRSHAPERPQLKCQQP